MLTSDLERIIDEHAYTADGDKIGKVGTIYLDDASGDPEFVTVKTGLFGTKESFAPVREARVTDDGLVLPYDKDKVKNAPKADKDQHLSPAEERDLYDYYGIAFAENPEPVEGPDRVRLREYVVTERR